MRIEKVGCGDTPLPVMGCRPCTPLWEGGEVGTPHSPAGRPLHLCYSRKKESGDTPTPRQGDPCTPIFIVHRLFDRALTNRLASSCDDSLPKTSGSNKFTSTAESGPQSVHVWPGGCTARVFVDSWL